LRWYALAVFSCLAVYFLVRGSRGRSRTAVRRNLEKHLGDEGKAQRPAGRSLSLLSSSIEKVHMFAERGRGERAAREQCDRLASDLALHLRCGIPVDEAVALCARDLGPPLSEALHRYLGEVALGANAGDALIELVRSLDSQDLELIALAAVTSRETGSDIRSVMGSVGEAVRERAAIRRELLTQTVQGRMSGRIVAGLPFIFLALSALVSRGTISVLLGTVPGVIMLSAAATLDVLGFLWIRKILDIKS
jgi:tight adherence protein B